MSDRGIRKFFVGYGYIDGNGKTIWTIENSTYRISQHGMYVTNEGNFEKAFDTEESAINSIRELRDGGFYKKLGYC